MASVSTICDEDCRFNCVMTFNKTAQLGSSVVSHHLYSGVELNSNLKLELTYLNNHYVRVNQTVAFLRRNLRNCPQLVKERTYKSLIRPHQNIVVVYGTRISLRIELEKVSQISKLDGLSLVTQGPPGTVTNLLNELGWVPLQRHRLNTRLVVMWKVINNKHISLPMPTNVIHKQ